MAKKPQQMRFFPLVIDDMTGLSPSFCMHKIFLDDDHATSLEPQRRLNPNMNDVVRKEVQKLLDAGVMYPISDSRGG